MALITLRQLLDHAAEYGYGVPAFNINNLEQIRAIMETANETRSPVIIQVSLGAHRYAGHRFIRALIFAATEEWPHIPICMHQDHGASPAVCQRSIQMGFTSVMMDGSLLEDQKTPSNYEYNVSVTSLTVRMAHACGVSVEGELGCLGSLETLKSSKEDGSGAEGRLSREQILTDPKQAVDFVEKTKVDALAIAIGTSHGAYKFSQPPEETVLVIDRIKAIHERLPNTHLVMHGSSSVPQEWLRMINKYGGNIPGTYGVPITEIQEGIRYGVRKINIDTDLRLASTGAIRRYLAKNPSQFDPRKYLGETLNAMKTICKMRYEAFGTAGKADKIKVIPLEQMTERYKNNELAMKIQSV
ncbi:class II fructose-bisphosphate aldolase [Coxiella endosymbiont of Amblyomma americanum]|uniref:class II fructose-bisphosphate aldolase n=1 Tax=Coxiella endosymbiont of Amblyomma americanum TaxID=325775 RepID=UPI00057E28B2|nr:class II fructose-bisphosphate aldolase [Coxiella endosymbiont of Amblyomma americanum]AJC50181.1 fructose-1,6-bisphosphate aldolase [Coxiella endosymbiont of Amblyomma americanum]AUJ58542.1 fructose-1,6-bisphosphate aldolase [Coxiella-like endosymbiont of Amblyomma americanum]